MKPNFFEHYKLTLDKKSDYYFIKNVLNLKTKENKFTQESNKKGEKLYVIVYKKEIIYVGITNQPIRIRLGRGLITNGKIGYKWKYLKNVNLFIWPEFVKDKTKKPLIRKTEIIEGELVYYIRKKTGKWPKYQNETHFHNSSENLNNIVRALFIITIKRSQKYAN